MQVNHWIACFFGAFPLLGRLACCFNLHLCRYPEAALKNDGIFVCMVCHRTIRSNAVTEKD